MKNVPSAAAGTSSCLSDEQHEPPSIEVNVSIARLDSSGSAHCRLLFHICKRRLWSTTIKLSSFQSWIIYTDLFFFPPARIISLHPSCPHSLETIELESPSKGFHFTWHSLPDCSYPLGDICLSICVWGGRGHISESEWSVQFSEWKLNMLYTSTHSKCWWRLRFLTKPAGNTVSFVIRLKGQMILKLRVVNFLCKSIQIGLELHPKKKDS